MQTQAIGKIVMFESGSIYYYLNIICWKESLTAISKTFIPVFINLF